MRTAQELREHEARARAIQVAQERHRQRVEYDQTMEQIQSYQTSLAYLTQCLAEGEKRVKTAPRDEDARAWRWELNIWENRISVTKGVLRMYYERSSKLSYPRVPKHGDEESPTRGNLHETRRSTPPAKMPRTSSRPSRVVKTDIDVK